MGGIGRPSGGCGIPGGNWRRCCNGGKLKWIETGQFSPTIANTTYVNLSLCRNRFFLLWIAVVVVVPPRWPHAVVSVPDHCSWCCADSVNAITRRYSLDSRIYHLKYLHGKSGMVVVAVARWPPVARLRGRYDGSVKTRVHCSFFSASIVDGRCYLPAVVGLVVEAAARSLPLRAGHGAVPRISKQWTNGVIKYL